MTRLPRAVWDEIDKRAAAGATSLSQIVADLVCEAVDMPDLVGADDARRHQEQLAM